MATLHWSFIYIEFFQSQSFALPETRSVSLAHSVRAMAMASLPLYRWSLKNAADSSSVELSTVPCNFSVSFFSQSKRRRFVASATHSSSPSSSSDARSRSKKGIDFDDYSSSQRKVVDNAKKEVVLAARKRPTISFKSLFWRRSQWRRILFASKKVRSIILLNVITIIYCKLFLF